jgi:hypothetical protein
LSVAFRGQLKNAVFGIQLTKGKVAFTGFVDGYPLIGFDKVVSLESLDDVTADYLKELTTEQASTVEFFGSEGLFSGRNVSPFDKAWFGKLPKKVLSAARVRRAKSRIVLWGFLGLVVVAVGFGMDAYDTHQKEAAKKTVHAVLDPNALYSKSVAAYLGEAGYPAAFLASDVIQKVNNLPLFHKGWRVQGGSCKPTTDAVSCVVTWANTDGGTFMSFSKSGLPGVPVYRTEYKEGMTTLDTRFDFATKAPRGVKVGTLMSRDTFTVNYGSTAQTLKGANLNINFTKPTVVALPPSPAGSPPITETSIKEPVREGAWTMTGSWMFYSSLTDMPQNMTIENLEFAVAGDSITMNVTGKFYVKN